MIGGKYAEMFALGVRNMWGYKLRSLLSLFGIALGIAAVIVNVGVAEGAQEEILAQIGRLGINNIIVNSAKPSEEDSGSSGGATSWVSRYGLTFKDYRQVKQTVPTATQVLPVHTLMEAMWDGSRKIDGKVHGVTTDHMRLLKLTVAAGRSLTVVDGLQLNKVCIVRPGLLRALAIYDEPLGHLLQVGDTYYEIVGILEEEEFSGYTQKALNVDNRNLEIYAPYETVLKRHGTTSFVRKSGSFQAEDVELHQIVVEVDERSNVLSTARMIQRILEKFHKDRDYELIVPLELLEQLRKTQQVFNVFMLAIAAISLVVGGIGIMNIMLATITERTREIGIRRAVGAKRRHIVSQFLTETVTLASIGGALGFLVGVVVLPLFEALTGWPAGVPAWAVLLAIGVSFAVGVLAGLYPAIRAARMDPIAALRYE